VLNVDTSEVQNYLESYEIWCWRRMEMISWTKHVRNEEALHTVKEERNILLRIKKRKAKWIGHILHMKCLLKHRLLKRYKRTQVTGGLRRPKQLLYDIQERRGHWKLEKEH